LIAGIAVIAVGMGGIGLVGMEAAGLWGQGQGIPGVFSASNEMNDWTNPLLRLALWIALSAAGVALYYRIRQTNPGWVAGRSFVVAFLFWAGVIGSSVAWSGLPPESAHWAMLLMLWVNARICLLPGLVARSGRSIFCHAGLCALALGCWVMGISIPLPVFIAGLTGVLLLLGLGLSPWPRSHRACLADFALWAPPLLMLLWR
jgi:hypothetical protein